MQHDAVVEHRPENPARRELTRGEKVRAESERHRRADRIQECGAPGGFRVGRRDPLLRETIAMDVKA